MSKNLFVDEYGFEDEVWGGNDHLTDGGGDPASDAPGTAVAEPASDSKISIILADSIR